MRLSPTVSFHAQKVHFVEAAVFVVPTNCLVRVSSGGLRREAWESRCYGNRVCLPSRFHPQNQSAAVRECGHLQRGQ